MSFVLSAQDMLYLVGTVAIFFVTVFLCWALYEIARFARQGNEVFEETREKVEHAEQALLHLAEKMSATSQYLGLIATAGRELFTWIRRRSQDEDTEVGEDIAEEVTSVKKQKLKHH